MAQKYAFLHIGKTGGTAFRDVIQQHNKTKTKNRIAYMSHKGSLKEIAREDRTDRLIFFVRDPASRFVSAFNSRLRKGRYGDHDWNPGEKAAFARFKTANELAEALSSWNPFRRIAALRAIASVGHLKKSLNRYIGPLELLEKEKDRIFYIGHQLELASDFENIKALLEMDPALTLPDGERSAHRSPDDVDRRLSDKAVRNIRRHFKKDFPLYEWCLKQRQELLMRYGLAPGGKNTPFDTKS